MHLPQGTAVAVLGPTLVDLEVLFHTDTKSISASFLAVGGGYLIGSFLCGFIFDRLIPEIQLATTCLVMGATTAIAPWPGILQFFVGTTVIQGISMGYTDAGTSCPVNIIQFHLLARNAAIYNDCSLHR